jgi:uncharacterized protein (TIGR02271 family)
MTRDDDGPARNEDLVIPVVEEEIAAGAQPVKTGSVRVEKHVDRRIRRIETDLLQEEVEIRRLPVNRVVEEPPAIRRDGDVIIVPVVEEELIVTKRFVLKEEIHLVKRRTRNHFEKEIPVEKERAEIRRLDAHGRVIDAPRRRAPAPRTPPRRGLLD